MTAKLKFKQHLRAAINILLPFSEEDRGYMAFIAVLTVLGTVVATIVTWSTEPAHGVLEVILWFAGVYAVFHIYGLLNVLLLMRLGPDSFRENLAVFWRRLAKKKFAFEGFWRRRRRRQFLKSLGYDRETSHYLASKSS